MSSTGIGGSSVTPRARSYSASSDGSIFIDESLDPEENPAREGRYRFTLAHEGGGHWRLHRHLVMQDAAQISFFDAVGEPKFVCRSSQAKERVEWQADLG
jgi:hypothetical protein